jgi:glycerophosphoryl diester phosphodiesterase
MMTFSQRALARMRIASPTLPLVYLVDHVPVRWRDGSLPRGVETVGVGVKVLREHPRYVERVQKAGHQVHVWTVDEPEDVERCLDAGVQAIITNRPDAVLHQLGRAR